MVLYTYRLIHHSRFTKKAPMQDLIQKIKDNAGISETQAIKAVETIKEFVKEKFPMLAGAVDNLFGHNEATEEKDELNY
jgi:hypothetical protein